MHMTLFPLLGYANSADSVHTLQNATSDQGQHSLFTRISMQNTIKCKHQPGTPKIRNGRIQMLRVEKSPGQNMGLILSGNVGIIYLFSIAIHGVGQ